MKLTMILVLMSALLIVACTTDTMQDTMPSVEQEEELPEQELPEEDDNFVLPETTLPEEETNGEAIVEQEAVHEETNNQEEGLANAITREELAEHNSRASCWVAWQGEVYDLTSWLSNHPGGAARIMPHCGTVEEFSQAFQDQHNRDGRRDDGMLRQTPIGVLAN